MNKNILLLLCIACSISIYAQTGEIKDIWQDKLGAERTNLVLQAVEKWDTSFTINTEPIISVDNTNLPFMILDNGNKLLFYVQEKRVPILSKSVDVYSYTDVKLKDEQLRDAAVKRNYAVIFDFKSFRLVPLEKKGEKLVAKYGSSLSGIQINNQYALVFDFGADIFSYQRNGLINETFSMAQYSWNKGLNCDLYIVSLENGTRVLVKKGLQPSVGKFPLVQFSGNNKRVRYCQKSNCYSFDLASGKTEIEKDTTQAQLQFASLNISLAKSDTVIQTDEINWKTFDGRPGRGVLAKPKDFNPKNKYPVIFVLYEKSVIKKNDNRLYGMGDFVDYGYLVFSPDLKYTIGQTGNSVVNYVVSAAEYLKQLPYVDGKRMGVRGASFGGYETNYIFTHSSLFAAAISMAGYTDLISNIGAMDNGARPHGLEGTDQNRLGVTMWQRPDIWIKNSPIFYADRITTPLLLIHSESDENVPFEQSLAFFRALRSMGKRSWLLQYDDYGHIGLNSTIVGKDDGGCDFCTRQLQFFNHYLKGEPAPLWMLDGIPAREKGKNTGLELDTLGRTPGPGLRREKLILTSEQEELLKHRTMVTDDGRIIDVGEKKKGKR
jgi:dienelactone hydrolase